MHQCLVCCGHRLEVLLSGGSLLWWGCGVLVGMKPDTGGQVCSPNLFQSSIGTHTERCTQLGTRLGMPKGVCPAVAAAAVAAEAARRGRWCIARWGWRPCRNGRTPTSGATCGGPVHGFQEARVPVVDLVLYPPPQPPHDNKS